MEYKVKGRFDMGRSKGQKFEKIIEARSEVDAEEKIYSLIGSKHKVKRRNIDIKSIRNV